MNDMHVYRHISTDEIRICDVEQNGSRQLLALTRAEATKVAFAICNLLEFAAPSAPSPQGWQPIETAPKRGRIMLGREGNPFVEKGWWEDADEGIESRWMTATGPMVPTHWQELPTPPATERS